MNPPRKEPLSPGTRLAHYEIGEPLGEGAMGTVYSAHDTALDRPVAIKVLRPEVAGNGGTVERFVREARAAARVNHPNLTHVYFVGSDDSHHFFAMELLDGRNLEEVVSGGPLELATAVDVLVKAARGLAAAHAAGVVHRDVKPGNLMLLPNGTVKITDFGLAKSVAGETDETGAGTILGTPRYMSPEQCRGEPLDVRTDVYSLGLVGFFLLAGRHPFTSEQIGKLLDEQMNAPLPDLHTLRPALPAEVGEVLSRLTAKRREDRPGSMTKVEALLESIRPQKLELASLTARVTAVAIDLLAVAAIAAGASFVSRLFFGFDLRERFAEWSRLVYVVLFFLFEPVSEWRFGTSLGKRLLFLAVVREDGGRPGLARVTARFFLRLPVFLATLVPVVVVWIHMAADGLQLLALLSALGFYLFAAHRTPWDMITRTRVVYHGRKDRSKG